MRNLNTQKGMTAIGWLLVLALIGFFVLIVLRLAPVYLEYSKVVTVLEDVANEPNIRDMTRSDIVSLISRRFDVNDVDTIKAKDAVIDKEDGVTTIQMKYERREHFIANIDVVASFDKVVRATGR